MTQLAEFVSRAVFKELGLEDVFFDMDVMRDGDPTLVASGLRQQIERMKSKFLALDQSGFEARFSDGCVKHMKQLRPVWDEKWRELCSGKLLLEDMRREGHFRGDLLKLKKAVITEMRVRKTETYTSLDSLLGDLLDGN